MVGFLMVKHYCSLTMFFLKLDFFVYVISCENCRNGPISFQFHKASPRKFLWMNFHIWKMKDQMWHLCGWSFLYKETHYSTAFSWMNLCVWKCHVWSIASGQSGQSFTYRKKWYLFYQFFFNDSFSHYFIFT